MSRHTSKVGWCATAATLLLSATVAPAMGSSTGEAPVRNIGSRLAWAPCDAEFECATARVPLDYDRPHGATTELSVIRLRATDQAHPLGTLFVNPGGPAASGVTFEHNAAADISKRVRGRFDIVSWDLRGSYGSAGLRCFPTQAARDAVLAPFSFPVSRSDVTVQHRADRRLSAACRKRGGPILDHMTTADQARDLDRLRALVGDRQLTYYGASYGSILGTTYANLFPHRVRALVVDSVMDPAQWTTGRPGTRRVPVFARAGAAAASERALRHFFALCDAAADGDESTSCSFGPSSRQRYTTLARNLKKHPLSIPGEGGTTTFGHRELEAITVHSLYEVPAWSSLADTLTALSQLDGERAAKSLRRLTASGQEQYDDMEEAFRAVTCADADTATRTSSYAKAADNYERRYPHVGRLWAWVDSACAFFPGDDSDRYTGPWNARTTHPVLVVGTRYDPALPYANAVALSKTLPNSRLLTLDGVSHGSFVVGQSSCIDGAIGGYLLSSTPPPAGTTCHHDVPPFATGMTKSMRDERRLRAWSRLSATRARAPRGWRLDEGVLDAARCRVLIGRIGIRLCS